MSSFNVVLATKKVRSSILEMILSEIGSRKSGGKDEQEVTNG